MSSPVYDTQRLSAALEHFRATRSAYLSTSDQALTSLLITLTETTLALQSGQPADTTQLTQTLDFFRATRPPNLSTADQALSDLLSALGEQVLQISAGAPASAPAAAPTIPLDQSGVLQSQIDLLQLTLRSQEATITRLQNRLGDMASHTPRWAADVPPVQPPMMRPTEYWAEHVPDYGDNGQVSGEQVREHLTRPRVRPEDVQLTAEDLQRIRQRERRPTKPSWDIRSGRIEGQVPVLTLLLVAILALLTLWFYRWMGGL